ncbi:unnamed protein product, partial [Mesorhabditis spiculigera]
MTAKWGSTSMWRNIVAFWIFGLCNNYGYVIMLSAAEDIISQQQHKESEHKNSSCLDSLGARACDGQSVGGVLLADILPSLIIKATMPFLMGRVPYGFRHTLVIALQIASYLVVAFSTSYPISLVGVVLASAGSGVGETTYLSLSSHFSRNVISAWSSGTGGAGVVGSFAYAALTEPHLGNLSPKNALLVMLVIPVIFAIAYWLLLEFPATVYTPRVSPTTWVIPHAYEGEQDMEKSEKSEQDARVPQRVTNMKEKMSLLVPLLKLMIPLSVVYFAEYLINQGLTQLIYFNCKEGFRLSKSSQYRWYQVLYQVGVFFSRSSVNIIELPLIVLFILPILQLGNAVFFFFEARYAFLPHISIVFALILVEGFYGGASYVNTFNWIHKNIPPDVKEYSLSIASMSDAFGIVLSAFTAIGLHNYICGHLG